MVKRRELPGFGIMKEFYEIAQNNLEIEKKIGKVPGDAGVSLYCESLLMVAIKLRARELKQVELKDRLVLTPDEAAGRG